MRVIRCIIGGIRMAKKTYVVTHPNLHLRVERGGKSKLERLDKGTEYTCEALSKDNHLIKGKKLVLASEAKKASAPSKD